MRCKAQTGCSFDLVWTPPDFSFTTTDDSVKLCQGGAFGGRGNYRGGTETATIGFNASTTMRPQTMAAQTRSKGLQKLSYPLRPQTDNDWQEERKRSVTAEQQTCATTLGEYIAACHSLVFSRFELETDKGLTSKGSITNPRKKLCPTSLEPLPDFLKQQRFTFGVLYDALLTRTRLFEPQNFLSGL